MERPKEPNPWLDIPLGDYEAHMNAPEVAQLSALSELFAEVLADGRPESVAVLGIAGGNGLEHIDPAVTRRVVGVDLNPDYLEAVRRRFGQSLSLDLHCADLTAGRVSCDPVQLVHAALIFEHAGMHPCLDNALSLVAPGGLLSAVLQLPAASAPNVAATSIASIQTLADHFCLIDPEHFCSTLDASGFRLLRHTRRDLPGAKAFWMGVFKHA